MTDHHDTVEQLVRSQLSKALGGRRGVVESAIPTVVFTVSWIISHDLRSSLILSVGAAVLLLAVRLIQRSTPQFVLNALFGIGIAAIFASRSGQAKDVFLPGILINSGSAVVMVFTILIGWPLVGFMVGSVTGDPTAWHADKAIVTLCSRLTWLFALPCIVRVVVQYPLWAGDHVASLGTSKIILGWPLLVASLAAMAYVLGRNKIPLEPAAGRTG